MKSLKTIVTAMTVGLLCSSASFAGYAKLAKILDQAIVNGDATAKGIVHYTVLFECKLDAMRATGHDGSKYFKVRGDKILAKLAKLQNDAQAEFGGVEGSEELFKTLDRMESKMKAYNFRGFDKEQINAKTEIHNLRAHFAERAGVQPKLECPAE